MLFKRLALFLGVLSFSPVIAQAQLAPTPQTLVPEKTVERQIAGGESHTYQITLTTGQFVRVVVEQRGINVKLALAGPDGKPLVESDLTSILGAPEPLSYEAAVAGTYQLVVRANGAATKSGPYETRLVLKASASDQDHKRMIAESLLNETRRLLDQRKTGDPQLSEKLGQALGLGRELEDHYLQGLALNLIGLTHAESRLYDKAIEAYEQALTQWRGEKLRLGEAALLNNIGDINRNRGLDDKSVEYYEQALAIQREVKNRAGEARALTVLANAYRRLSRIDKASEYFEQALEISRETRDKSGEADALNSLGSFYYSLARFEKAIEFYEQTLIIRRQVKDREGEGGAQLNLGATYNSSGRNDKAIEYYEQALVVMREVKNRSAEGFALTGLGNVHRDLGHYDKAIEYGEQSIAIYRDLNDRNNEGLTLSNLGAVNSRLGRHEKAINYYEQALSIVREVKNRRGETAALNNLGISYSRLGRYDEAIAYYEQALALSREIKSRDVEGNNLLNLGVAYESLGRYDKVIQYSEQALQIGREVKVRTMEAAALSNLGNAYSSLKQHDKAVGYLEQALAILREVKFPSNEASILYRLAKAERERGNLSRARGLTEETLKIVESLRSEIYNQESRVSYFASVQTYNSLYIDLLMRLHKASPSQGFDALAIEASEHARARGLLELLTESGAQIREGVNASLLERERTLALQLNAKATRRMQLLRVAHNPAQMTTLAAEVSQLENDYEQAQAAIRKASPHYAALTRPQPLKLKEIQAQLDADTLLLEYALDDESSYLWAISKDSLSSYELPKGELIEKSARQVYELLTARSINKRGETAPQRQARISQAEANLPAAARELSQTILAPVAPQLGNNRLVIVADGALQYIPFGMLPEPSVVSGQLSVAKNNGPRTTDNGQPLIVNHEVVSLPSASALAIQRSELGGRQPAPKMLAVIADPVFDRSDSRFTTPAAETGDKTETITGDNARSLEHLAGNSGDKSGVTTLSLVIPRLPFTRQEATRVLALTPKNSSFGATDFQASRATALDPALGQYRYLHFATHGYLDSERPGLSALLFSMVDAQGKPQNGFLRANDIYNLKLPAELVVLSACQTGLGKDIKGEGLVGLTRGFMYAGAARVVVSLWNVNDKATADLMTKFYEKMLKQGQRPAAALRAAQVEMWKQKQWQSPYYWAAFTMQGEWR